MMSIIKADAAQPVRPFASRSSSPASAETPPDLHELERAELRAEVTRLQKQIEDLQASSKDATARALEEGRQQGIDGAVRDEEGRRTAIEQGMADALRAWSNRLTEIEELAALLSRAALAKLFDEPAKLAELVVPAIGRQMQHIRRETVVMLRVSKADFPDEADFATLAAAAGRTVRIVASPELAAGECFLDLQLGKMDVSPLAQWRALEALLGEIADRDRPA